MGSSKRVVGRRSGIALKVASCSSFQMQALSGRAAAGTILAHKGPAGPAARGDRGPEAGASSVHMMASTRCPSSSGSTGGPPLLRGRRDQGRPRSGLASGSSRKSRRDRPLSGTMGVAGRGAGRPGGSSGICRGLLASHEEAWGLGPGRRCRSTVSPSARCRSAAGWNPQYQPEWTGQ